MGNIGKDIELLIVKELTYAISENEQQLLENWKVASEYNALEYDAWKKAWLKSEGLKAFKEEDAVCAWQLCRQKMHFTNHHNRIRNYKWIRQVAAVMIPALLFIGGFLLNQNVPGFGKLQAFHTSYKSDSIVLADQSNVLLAQNSILVYEKRMEGKTRELKLSGRAYFKVSRDETKPFVVKVGKAQIEVLGTEFDLQENAINGDITLYVTKGSVKFSSEKEEVILCKDEMATCLNGRIFKSSISDNNFLSWKTGILQFNEAGFSTVLNALQNHFRDIQGVELMCSNPVEHITTKFQNPKLEDVLEELSIHFNKKFVINDGKLIISD